MKLFILAGLIAAGAIRAEGQCIVSLQKFMQKAAPGSPLEEHKYREHKIFMPSDSCGARGCEVFVFSPKSSQCYQLTLNVMGTLLPETLKRGHIGIRTSNGLRYYKYNIREEAFK